MTIRHSIMDDIPTLLTISEEAKGIMRRDGNMEQWGDNYPSAEVFENDIRRGVSYVMEHNGETVATFAAIPGPDPTYATIYNGQWIDDIKPYIVIHRIASRAESHGVMTEMLNFCFNMTDNIRIDTHRDNHIMQHLMAKHGFRYCGIIYLANGDERLAYQRTI
ncbi:MAG: GNAT family N-acetyltransferase [Prevotella sp.]|nr:GNAT family N-acetyltransferase [Prevotella sp.]MBQ6161844.1 GNAT family N-acetyltransferase [Prevotella sp.]MBQ6187021.1 GNAT family N-acetyltransferase [Prevotella sp.]